MNYVAGKLYTLIRDKYGKKCIGASVDADKIHPWLKGTGDAYATIILKANAAKLGQGYKGDMQRYLKLSEI